jgi:hypothetical protein
MLKRHIIAATLLLVSASEQPHYPPPTQEEADRIKASLQSYLGSETGVVAVAAQGDDYVVTLDATPYIAKRPPPGLTAKVDPVVLTIAPQGQRPVGCVPVRPLCSLVCRRWGNVHGCKNRFAAVDRRVR